MSGSLNTDVCVCGFKEFKICLLEVLDVLCVQPFKLKLDFCSYFPGEETGSNIVCEVSIASSAAIYC